MNELGLVLMLIDTAAAITIAAGIVWIGSKTGA